MTPRKRKLTRNTGVVLELVVLDYLRGLAEREERDRSYCINWIVREHAKREGWVLPPATELPATPALFRPGESSAP